MKLGWRSSKTRFQHLGTLLQFTSTRTIWMALRKTLYDPFFLFPLSLIPESDFQDHYMTYGKPIWVTEFACVDGR